MVILLRKLSLDGDGAEVLSCAEVLHEEFQAFHARVFAQLKPGENATNELDRGIRWGSYANDTFSWLDRRTYSLAAEKNPEEQGRIRRFVLIPSEYLERPEIETLMRRVFSSLQFRESSFSRSYEVQLSAIRYAPTLAKPSLPSPIGPHQDEIDGAVAVISRSAHLIGGRTRLYDLNNEPHYELDLDAGEALVIRDQRVKHQVTPILLDPSRTWRPGQKVFRDILIVRFQPVGR